MVLNGSFNPPTLAHFDLLKKAMASAGAERGLFLPANDEYVRRKMAKFRRTVFAIREGRGSARRPVEENGKFAPFYATFGRWAK